MQAHLFGASMIPLCGFTKQQYNLMKALGTSWAAELPHHLDGRSLSMSIGGSDLSVRLLLAKDKQN